MNLVWKIDENLECIHIIQKYNLVNKQIQWSICKYNNCNMQKLGQIKLANTVQVKVECQLNEEVVVANFKIIMDCLKDLHDSHNDLAGKFSKLSDRLSTIENNSNKEAGNTKNNEKIQIKQANANNEQGSRTGSYTGGISESEKQNLLALIKQLEGRTSKNEKNIDDNIKDINLINKQIHDIKDLLAKLKSHVDSNKGSNDSNNANNTNNNESKQKSSTLTLEGINNINKQMQNNKQAIAKTNQQLQRLRKQLADMKNSLNKVLEDQSKIKFSSEQDKNNAQSANNGGKNGRDGSANSAELSELRQKIAILNKKTNGLQIITDTLKNQTTQLGQGQVELQNTCNNLTQEINKLRQELNNLKQSKNQDGKNGNSGSGTGRPGVTKAQLDFELNQLRNQIRQLRNEIDDLKRNQPHSKTSIEDERKGSRFDKAAYTQANKFKDDDKFKDLLSRIQYLEKLMGSRNSITDKSEGQDKLPLIKRGKGARDRQFSGTHDKSTSKKDIADIKADLQAWLNNYLLQNKNKDNFEDLQLKLQQIRNTLNKKADQEGLKKGLGFLQAKINQLYLFLTEPDGDDAMIVRKGFNCLSCSKKVQKLRGKLGPHINWNNMTATNYSPPKVGYSRHMNQTSTEKQEDL